MSIGSLLWHRSRRGAAYCACREHASLQLANNEFQLGVVEERKRRRQLLENWGRDNGQQPQKGEQRFARNDVPQQQSQNNRALGKSSPKP